MEAIFLLALIVQGTLVGLLCSYVAGQKHRSKGNWFLLGFFFSLLALIALAAIPILQAAPAALPTRNEDTGTLGRSVKVNPDHFFQGERDLDNDAYKIWLVEHFKIARNDALNALVCESSLFPTIEAALLHADKLYSERVAQPRLASHPPDISVDDLADARRLGIEYSEDRYVWNGNHFKSVRRAIEFATSHQPILPASTQRNLSSTESGNAVNTEEISLRLREYGIRFEEDRYVWRGNHFKRPLDAIAYAERNQAS